VRCLQRNGLPRRDAAGTAGPQNLSRQMHGLRRQGKDYGRQLRRPLGRRLSLDYRLFNLVREDREMAGEPVKHLALGLVRCEVADQGAFGCVFPELFYLRQIVLHCRCPP
jgi:hypothetical protein